MKGRIWNESKIYQDPVTLRKVRQITTQGIMNTIPSYHTNQSFSETGEEVIFTTVREGKSLLCKANLLTGDIMNLIHPVDGIGGLNDDYKFGNGKGIPIGAVLAPKSRWVYYLVEREIRAVHMDTLEEKKIVCDVPEDSFVESLAISPDEKKLVYVVVRQHPETVDEMYYKIYMKPMDGESYVLLEEKGLKSGHLMYNPVDDDYLLLCRDRGPGCLDRIDEHGRMWIYKISEQKLIEVETKAKQNFQTHIAWSWDGKSVVYHGELEHTDWIRNENDKGWYIGQAGLDGKVIREYHFPDARYYGHVSAGIGKNAALIDGNIMDGLLMWLYFDEEKPKVEIICRHDSDFTVMPCQYSHPHAISDPSRRWIVFNSARRVIFTGGRSDIYAVEL